MEKEGWRLNLLADFLNFKFDEGDPDELRGKSPYHVHEFMYWKANTQEGIEEAKHLQSEILDDITPIVPPAKADERKKAYDLLEGLVQKINEIGLIPEWGVEPVGSTWVQVGDPERQEYDLERIDSSGAKDTNRDLGPRQGVLGVLGYEWVVNTRVSLRHAPSLRDRLYWNIIDALESGELSRLRRCLNCGKFFVAEDPRQKFCTPGCMKAADQRSAVERVRKWRRKEAEKREQMAAVWRLLT